LTSRERIGRRQPTVSCENAKSNQSHQNKRAGTREKAFTLFRRSREERGHGPSSRRVKLLMECTSGRFRSVAAPIQELQETANVRGNFARRIAPTDFFCKHLFQRVVS